MLGQDEVSNFLEQNKGKIFTAKEIAKKTNLSIGSVHNNLRRLKKWNMK